jgi:hypothetical protein
MSLNGLYQRELLLKENKKKEGKLLILAVTQYIVHNPLVRHNHLMVLIKFRHSKNTVLEARYIRRSEHRNNRVPPCPFAQRGLQREISVRSQKRQTEG